MRGTYSFPNYIKIQIQRPVCSRCQTHMMLSRISPARMGVDVRTFECPRCDYAHEIMVVTDAFGT